MWTFHFKCGGVKARRFWISRIVSPPVTVLNSQICMEVLNCSITGTVPVVVPYGSAYMYLLTLRVSLIHFVVVMQKQQKLVLASCEVFSALEAAQRFPELVWVDTISADGRLFPTRVLNNNTHGGRRIAWDQILRFLIFSPPVYAGKSSVEEVSVDEEWW